MSDKKKQHLVPCSYMKFFSYNYWEKSTRKCNVFYYDKHSKKIWYEIRTTEWVFHKRNYYTILIWWRRNIEIENFLWKFEEKYADIYTNLIKNKYLEENDYINLMMFVSLQLFRTNRWKQLINETLWNNINDDISKISIPIFANEMTKILTKDFIFCLYKAPSNTNFITTDTPVFWRHLTSEELDPCWYEPFEFIFPLSSEYLILAFHNKSNLINKIPLELRNNQFVECNNIDNAFMNRINYEIWFYWNQWIISKRKEELNMYKSYTPNNTLKQLREYWKICFIRENK